MIVLSDQVGNEIILKNKPNCIVSLVPSQTELLVDLGLIDSIIGITKFCVHPENLRKQKTVVGGTKQVDVDQIRALNPDVILCNKEENTKGMVEALQTIAPVHVSDIATLSDAYILIEHYGLLFNKAKEALSLIESIKSKESTFAENRILTNSKKCIYLIWQKPFMAAGADTFINHLLECNGLENSISQERYPEVSLSQLDDTDLILLSSEPFPFSKKHLEELQKLTKTRAILVDGEYFSWYGSRLLKAFDYFEQLQKTLG